MMVNGKTMHVVEQRPVQSRESVIRTCYENIFPVAAAYVRNRGGNLEEAKELFQDALVTYFEKLVNAQFEPEQHHDAYLMGIFKNHWLKYKTCTRSTMDLMDQDFVEEKESKVLKFKLLQFLRQSGQRCMDLLQAFYYEKIPMKELADRFGYRSERSVTVQKYKCLEKVRTEVKQKSQQYEDFFE